jgi:protein O-GlcNAc transferase
MRLFDWMKRRRTESPTPVPDSAHGDPAQRGVAALGRGDFGAAVSAFRQALAIDSASAANHVNLAYALQQTGSDAEALTLLRNAVDLDPESFDALYMLGGALERAQDLEGAGTHLRSALALRPEFEPARTDLCRVLAAGGDAPAAREAILAAIALNPMNADFHHYLGNVCMAESDPAGAVLSYEHALTLRPDYTAVHLNLGLARHTRKEFDAAAHCFERALALDPASRDAHANLGLTRKVQGRFVEAAASLQRALTLAPADADTLNELGGVYLDQGLLDQAIDYYGRAIALHPKEPGGYGNLGLALYEKGDLAGAVAAYRQGLSLRSVANIHDNLAIALLRQGLAHEAVDQFRLALAAKPEDINTRTNLAAALTEASGPSAGIEAYREILECHPDQLAAHSNLLFNLTYAEDCGPGQYLEEARRFSANLTRGLLDPPSRLAADRTGPLRIGFVSGDLHGHPVGYFLEGVLRHLDPSRFELFAYPTIAKFDALSARIQPLFKGWHLIKGMTDAVAARLIRDDAIDILIDLAGHTGDNRLPMFALRPAPVQISWLGYFASTGVAEMDYILVDEACVPAGQECYLSEKAWRLPDTRLCYTPPPGDVAPPVTPLPALARGHITFGCFQRFQKISDAVLATWGQVFLALPDARLLLQCQQCVNPMFVERMLDRLDAVGIAADRVWTRPAAPHSEYLQSYAQVDIALDTFPYNGGTTTCEALWMGVPTLTLCGDSMLARQGAALMGAAGLSDWVAANAQEFVQKAAEFAGDPESLARLRASLRERVRSCPLFDTALFAKRLEQALADIWQESAR